MFLDKVKITCQAGKGGDGKTAWHREKFVPNGGPDGGDGGKGGDIVFLATTNLSNLVDFRYTKNFKAQDGEGGGKRNCDGKKAPNLTIKVPKGTVIKNAKTGKVIADLTEEGQTFVALKGGKGGRGNSKFATPTRQAPNFSEMGEKTEPFELVLELKTLADVGLIGFPNVGKSSLLAAVSNAKPKIANYHFTTLAPNIGVVKANNGSSVWADIPGLIEGASEGHGLGLEFLRHIERTRLLLHVIDASGSEGRDPYEDYVTINQELQKYSDKVKNTPQIIVLNKMDLVNDKSSVEVLKEKIGLDKPMYEISAVAHMGLNELVEGVVKMLKELPQTPNYEIEEQEIDKKDKTQVIIEEDDEHAFVVSGYLIDEIVKGVNVDDFYSNAYFQKRLKDEGVIDKLLEAGMQEGDTVKIEGYEFEYTI